MFSEGIWYILPNVHFMFLIDMKFISKLLQICFMDNLSGTHTHSPPYVFSYVCIHVCHDGCWYNVFHMYLHMYVMTGVGTNEIP